jgi:hypothetical protein
MVMVVGVEEHDRLMAAGKFEAGDALALAIVQPLTLKFHRAE